MAEEKDQNKAQEQAAPKGPFVHQLQVYLVGGQTFTINEVTDSPNMPNNVVAFINAWRQKRDVWHSPNEYRVGTPAPKADDAKKAPKPVKKVAADK